MALDAFTKFGLGMGGADLAGGLAGMFMGGNNNPYEAARGSFDQIPGAISPYYNPYIEAGHSALPQLQNQYGSMVGQGAGLQGQYNNLMNDPAGFNSRLGAGFQQSPGFAWQMKQGMNAANNAAAAGGMLGTPQHQQQAATMAEGLANQDFNSYMSRVLGMYGTGLQGTQGMFNSGLQGMQGINNQGYNASNELAGALGSNFMNQGNLAYSGAAAKNQNQGAQMGDIISGLGTLAMFL